MKTNPGKAIFLLCWFSLFFSGCKKEAPIEPVPEGLVKFYPVSVTRTGTHTPDTFRSEFVYNSTNQIIRELIYKNEVLQSLNEFTYDAAGRFTKKAVFTGFGAKVRLTEEENITYSVAGLPERLTHGYVDTAGQFMAHHYRLYEFNAEGKLAKWTDYSPNGSVQTSRTYAYPEPGKVISPAFGSNGLHLTTSEITLDDKFIPFRHIQLNLTPYSGNERKHEIKAPSGQLVSGYSQQILYNEAGYPVKITQTHLDGIVKTETYAYAN